MKNILSTIALLLSMISAFGQVDAGKLPGRWLLCGDPELILTDTVTYSRPDSKCEEVNCSRHEWVFRENKEASYSWGTGCADDFFMQCLKSAKWAMENENDLTITYKDGKVISYLVLNLDNETLKLYRRISAD